MLSYNQLRFLAGCTSVTTIYSSLIGLRALRTIKKQNAQYEKLWKMTRYLASLTEENNISLSEFDLIALRELGMVEVEIKDED